MAPNDGPSSSKSEQQASKKSSDTRHDIDADEISLSPQDRIKWFKEEIRVASAGSLSLSIRLGKLKGAEARDLDLIRELEAEHESLQWVVTKDKEAIEEIEQELGSQQKEKQDNIPCRVDRRGAEMDDDGSAEE